MEKKIWVQTRTELVEKEEGGFSLFVFGTYVVTQPRFNPIDGDFEFKLADFEEKNIFDAQIRADKEYPFKKYAVMVEEYLRDKLYFVNS